MKRAYKVVDVFADGPLLGNPLAVVLDAQELDTVAMQQIARWTNLSETTFLLPPTTPQADYRVRIFTPRRELPFAGHPTLGTAYAAQEAGRVTPRAGRLVQECGVGLVTLSVEDTGKVRLGLPPATVAPLSSADVEELEAILGAPVVRAAAPAVINVGAVWVVAQIQQVEKLLALRPDFARCAAFEQRLGTTGVSVFADTGRAGGDIEVRSFAPSCGVEEDPVCGSGNGSVAIFRRDRGLVAKGTRYVATQGRCVGRDGQVAVNVDADGSVSVGGACVTCIDGSLDC